MVASTKLFSSPGISDLIEGHGCFFSTHGVATVWIIMRGITSFFLINIYGDNFALTFDDTMDWSHFPLKECVPKDFNTNPFPAVLLIVTIFYLFLSSVTVSFSPSDSAEAVLHCIPVWVYKTLQCSKRSTRCAEQWWLATIKPLSFSPLVSSTMYVIDLAGEWAIPHPKAHKTLFI